MQTLLVEVLRSEGYDISTADDGEQAVELINNAEFGLIITDVAMPGLNGVEVLRAAKRVDPHYPVILMTGFPSTDRVRKMIRLGASDYLVKPFDIDWVKVTVAKVLEMRMHLDLASSKGSLKDVPGIDSSTGVYNLLIFADLLQAEIGRSDWRSRECSLLIVKIERVHFEVSRGSQLLKQFVKLLRHLGRPGDTIGYIDDREFAMILPETTRELAKIRSQKLLKREGMLTVSCGIACYPEDAPDADALIKMARDDMAQ